MTDHIVPAMLQNLFKPKLQFKSYIVFYLTLSFMFFFFFKLLKHWNATVYALGVGGGGGGDGGLWSQVIDC